MQTVRNYYDVLGVSRAAPSDEIKRRFRLLARKYHPDVNPGDKAAEERFKAINEAYDVLSDSSKRADYDRRLRGQPRRSTYQSELVRDREGNPNFSPGMTKRVKVVNARPQRRDVEASLTLPLEKAYQGGRERIRLEDGRSLEVDMPPGMVDGQKIRLKEQGINGGDLYLKISLAEHPYFEVQGEDIFLQVPLTPSEAVLGGAIEVPTIDGLVKMNVPSGVKAGQRLRLAHKGYPTGENGRGDQLVEIDIVTPPNPSEAEKKLYQTLREIETFKPRSQIKL